jgi:DNA repair exonuclease SbcCD nuclease subunit
LFKKFYSEVFFPFLDKEGIKTVFVLGDFFDRRKFINFETLKLSREIFFAPLKERGIKVYAIVGNHDVMYKNTNEVNSLNLLVSEHGYDNVSIFTEPKTTVVDDVKVLMLPWINSENYERTVSEVRNSDARFVFSHLEMSGFEYHRGLISDRGHLDPDLLQKYEFVFSGHYHHRSSRGNIHYLGTPYEMNWADYKDPKGFHVFNGKELFFIENPEKTFVKMVYNDTNPKIIQKDLESLDPLKDKFIRIVVQKKDHPILFERFLDKITELGPADISIIDETNTVIDTNQDPSVLPQDTLEVIKNFVYNELQTDLSKDKLMRKLQEIYVSAKTLTDGE